MGSGGFERHPSPYDILDDCLPLAILEVAAKRDLGVAHARGDAAHPHVHVAAQGNVPLQSSGQDV